MRLFDKGRWAWLALVWVAPVGSAVQASTVGQLEQELIAAVHRVRPSVVAIKIHDVPWPGGPVHDKWASGVAIDNQGHVVAVGVPQPARQGKLEVVDVQGRTFAATFVGYDSHENLSVIKINPSQVMPVRLAGDALPKEGALIIAVGNPYGFAGSVCYGNVSGLNRSVGVGGVQRAGLVQFTAPINPGDSGGCLANIRGEMIGVIASSLARPPAFRITLASPSSSPRNLSGSSLASMQVRTVTLRAGGVGRSPLVKLAA